MALSPRYQIEQHITSSQDDDLDTRFKVRRNGKAFYINIYPRNFQNSPAVMDKYLAYLKVLRSGEEVLDDTYVTDVYDWAMAPFLQQFTELAPDPSGDSNDVTLSLKDFLFPDYFVFDLDAIDERLCPRRVVTGSSPYHPSYLRLEEDLLDDLETWTALYDPARIILSYPKPEDALFKPPKKVLIDNLETQCFFKACNSGLQLVQELKSYKKIHAAGLDSQFNLCHLHGVVMDDEDFILGTLLTYIDKGDCPLSTRVHPDDPDDPSPTVRKRWMTQIEASLTGLHAAGVIWGDVKAENILIDGDNAWVTDFGGGFTEGWVTQDLAGTVEGDLMGMKKLKDLMFPS